MFRLFLLVIFFFSFLAGCSEPVQEISVCGDGICSSNEIGSCSADCINLAGNVSPANVLPTESGAGSKPSENNTVSTSLYATFYPPNPAPQENMIILVDAASESPLNKISIDFGDGTSTEAPCSNVKYCEAYFRKAFSSEGRFPVTVKAFSSNSVVGTDNYDAFVSSPEYSFSCGDAQPQTSGKGIAENTSNLETMKLSSFIVPDIGNDNNFSFYSFEENPLRGRDFSESIEGDKASLIVQFNSKPLIEKAKELNLDLHKLGKNPELNFYLNYLKKEQDTSFAALSRFFKGLKRKHSLFNVFNGAVIEVDVEGFKEAIVQAEKLGIVKKIYPDAKVYPALSNSVPNIKADKVWALKDSRGLPLEGEGTVISIIDSGIDYKHSDLGGCFGPTCKVIGGYDLVNNDPDPMDDYGHGTHVAGIAAGNGKLKGVAPKAKLLAYKIFNKQGRGTFSDILKAMDLSVDPNQDSDYSDSADVINLSLGGAGNADDSVSLAVDNIVDKGVVVVAAAGNYPGYGYMGPPSASRKAISVGASLDNDVTNFSMNGPVFSNNLSEMFVKPDIVAPGYEICSALALFLVPFLRIMIL